MQCVCEARWTSTSSIKASGLSPDSGKASRNFRKHGVSLDIACHLFFDPFVRLIDTGLDEEAPRRGDRPGEGLVSRYRNGDGVKTASEPIRQRLRKDRQMIAICLRLPEDVIDDLKEIAPSLGFSGYQPLIRAYIGRGLARMENSPLQLLTESLPKHGIANEFISWVIAEARPKSA